MNHIKMQIRHGPRVGRVGVKLLSPPHHGELCPNVVNFPCFAPYALLS